MKTKITLLLFIIGTILISGCGPTEKQQAEQKKQDSLLHIILVKKTDSIKEISKSIKQKMQATQQAQDSLLLKELKKNKKAYKIWLAHPKWRVSECIDLANQKIWIGMTLDMLKVMRGQPNHVNVSNYGEGSKYQWCWSDYTPSCFYGKEDGVITSYN